MNRLDKYVIQTHDSYYFNNSNGNLLTNWVNNAYIWYSLVSVKKAKLKYENHNTDKSLLTILKVSVLIEE